MNGSPEQSGNVAAGVDYAQLHREQSLPIAVAAGIAAAIVGAVVWAVITVFTEYQIGFMAIGVGILVGFAVRLGKGVDKIFGVAGALLALFGCVLGNFFSLVGFICKQEKLGLLQTLQSIEYAKVPALMVSAFSLMDLVFYGIAVYEGYRFSFRQLAPPSAETAPPAPHG